jgi:hypothetical protein
MLLPLGILASSGGAAASDFQLISSQVLASTATSVTFSSIPSTFRHLQIRVTYHQNTSGYLFFTANNHSAAGSTSGHYLIGNGSTVVSDGHINWPGYFFNGDTGATDADGSSVFTAAIIDALDYSQTTKAKTYRSLWGQAVSGNNNVVLTSGRDASTEAVDTIKLWTGGAQLFAVGSRFSLYGWN